MSVTYDHGDIVFQCDSCRETLETGTSNFDAARNLLRRAHWKPFRNSNPRGDEWLHACAACQSLPKPQLNLSSNGARS
jgi:hypothetical protein